MTTQFNIGDRVLCTGSLEGKKDLIHKTGTVIDLIPDSPGVIIEFDTRFMSGHRGVTKQGKDGHCWNIWSDLKNLKLLKHAEILTTKERVNIKCKTLWNNSKYVKRNPKYAY